jgi:multidrug efflux system outer membrane protein
VHLVFTAILDVAIAAGIDLPNPLTLAEVTRAAMANNPELAASAAGARAARAAARGAGAFPEPMLSYQAWQQPLSRPIDPGATNMHMLGVRWQLPFPGQLGLAGRAAGDEASARVEDVRARRLAVQAQVAHAFVAWWRAAEELEVHLGHMAAAEKAIEAVKSRYSSGGATQADILRAETDLHRFHGDIAGIREAAAAARALLNATMGRPVDAPLPAAGPVEAAIPEGAPRERPEVVAARLRVMRARTAAELGDRARVAPDLMVGFDYMLMPGMPDAYSVMLQVGIPWLSGRRASEAERAAADADEARLAEVAAENAAGFEEAEARARARAAKAHLDTLDGEVIPRAVRTADSMRAAYLAGQADLVALLDAERSLLDARLAAVRQRGTLADAIGDLRRALGLDLLDGDKP